MFVIELTFNYLVHSKGMFLIQLDLVVSVAFRINTLSTQDKTVQTVTSVSSTSPTKLLTMELFVMIILMVLAFCVGLLVSMCVLLYFILFRTQDKHMDVTTTTGSEPSTFVHFPSPGLTPFRATRPTVNFAGALEDSMASTMSFGRILAHHQINSLEQGLQNILSLHENTYIESLVRGGGIDLRRTIVDHGVIDKRFYPTRRLFNSVDGCHVGNRLPTIADMPDLPEVHSRGSISNQSSSSSLEA